ncbi:hypothetical protein DFJ74DRAFT_517015 [Hyaloraphidium curvatum]|nr:hypothetical protein DFJ74DRAFT_517015 [Hyaloraphidium curvatum]
MGERSFASGPFGPGPDLFHPTKGRSLPRPQAPPPLLPRPGTPRHALPLDPRPRGVRRRRRRRAAAARRGAPPDVARRRHHRHARRPQAGHGQPVDAVRPREHRQPRRDRRPLVRRHRGPRRRRVLLLRRLPPRAQDRRRRLGLPGRLGAVRHRVRGRQGARPRRPREGPGAARVLRRLQDELERETRGLRDAHRRRLRRGAARRRGLRHPGARGHHAQAGQAGRVHGRLVLGLVPLPQQRPSPFASATDPSLAPAAAAVGRPEQQLDVPQLHAVLYGRQPVLRRRHLPPRRRRHAQVLRPAVLHRPVQQVRPVPQELRRCQQGDHLQRLQHHPQRARLRQRQRRRRRRPLPRHLGVLLPRARSAPSRCPARPVPRMPDPERMPEPEYTSRSGMFALLFRHAILTAGGPGLSEIRSSTSAGRGHGAGLGQGQGKGARRPDRGRRGKPLGTGPKMGAHASCVSSGGELRDALRDALRSTAPDHQLAVARQTLARGHHPTTRPAFGAAVAGPRSVRSGGDSLGGTSRTVAVGTMGPKPSLSVHIECSPNDLTVNGSTRRPPGKKAGG